MVEFDLNLPDTWASASVYSPPLGFDVADYQTKLDAIGGLSETNLPMVRLVWAGDRKQCFSPFYVTWYESGPKRGLGLSRELRAKYKYASVLVPGTSDVIDVPPPRWILEEFNHPGQYMASWEAARFVDGREMRPPPPPNGYYSHLWTIADHGNKDCCKEAVEQKVVCWGNYRQPDEKDLEVVRGAFFEREKDRFVDTTKPLDEQTLDILGKESADQTKKKQAAAEKELDEFIDEHALEFLEACGVPISGRARKLFSIPNQLRGSIKQESGIIVP